MEVTVASQDNFSVESRFLIRVKSTPKIEDPRELLTILTFSLRSLWGDLEPHSCDLTVDKAQNGISAEDAALLVVGCRSDSLGAVRASLTLVTLPPYLESIAYQFDVVEIDRGKSQLPER